MAIGLGLGASIALAAPDRCSQGPAEWQALMDVARQQATARDWPAAEALYRRILQLQEQDPCLYPAMRQFAWRQLGEALTEQGQFEAAIATYQAALRAAPDDATTRYALELAQGRRDRADAAITRGLAMLDREPDSPWGYRDLASGLAQRGQLATAWPRLEQQLGDRLTPARARFLAEAAQQTDNPTAAIALYRQILTRYPTDDEAYLTYGGWLDTLEQAGQPIEVVAAYREAIARYPMFGQWYGRLADWLARSGQFDQAIAVYHDWIRSNPTDDASYLALAQAYEQQRQIPAAIAQYQAIIRQFPDRGPVDRRCHVVTLTAYDRLVALLQRQNRLDELWDLLSGDPSSTAPAESPEAQMQRYAYAIVALGYAKEPARAAQMRQRFEARYPGQGEAIGPDGCGHE